MLCSGNTLSLRFKKLIFSLNFEKNQTFTVQVFLTNPGHILLFAHLSLERSPDLVRVAISSINCLTYCRSQNYIKSILIQDYTLKHFGLSGIYNVSKHIHWYDTIYNKSHWIKFSLLSQKHYICQELPHEAVWMKYNRYSLLDYNFGMHFVSTFMFTGFFILQIFSGYGFVKETFQISGNSIICVIKGFLLIQALHIWVRPYTCQSPNAQYSKFWIFYMKELYLWVKFHAELADFRPET